MTKNIVLALMILGIVSSCGQKDQTPENYSNAITAVRVEDTIPLTDPDAKVWKKAPIALIELKPQNIIPPIIQEPSIKQLRVRAIYNDNYFGMLLEWEDSTKDELINVNDFTDQVAIQFPINPENPGSFMMGNKGAPVHIIHWKALWQRDVEKGYLDVQDIYPNMWVDLYYFKKIPVYTEFTEKEIKFPRVDEFSPEQNDYNPAIKLRNPVSLVERQIPVEEAFAEGFGTFTTQLHQDAFAWGKYENGHWKVIIVRPLVSPDSRDAPLPSETVVAFAVWDGSANQIGGRKQYTPWIPLKLQ
ncbi:MAG: hypothetical protein GXO48_04215 [Chlorobi bacterium]|nr:hypothetical protein [Chlorobiota bacterium]